MDDISRNADLNKIQFVNGWRFLMIICGSAALTWFLWGPLFSASWSIINDHRSVSLIGNRPRLPFLEMLGQCNPPDFHLGSVVNRPTYFTVHALWAFLFGGNVTLWYSAKMLCFFVSAAAFWLACTRVLSFGLAGLLTLGIALQPCWSDVVPNAQTELYAALGSALFLLGLSALLKGPSLALADARTLPCRTLYAAVACLVSGGLIAVGSKEDFTVLIVAAALGLLVVGLVRDQPRLLLGAYGTVLAWGAVVLHGIYVGVLKKGVDLYGGAMSERASTLLPSLHTAESVQISAFLCVVLLLGVLGRRLGKAQLSINRQTWWSLTVIHVYFLFAVVFLNVFYHGDLPPASRYAVPYAMIPILSVALSYSAVAQGEFFGRLSPRGTRVMKLIGVCLAALLVIISDAGFNRRYSAGFARATLELKSRLAAVQDALRSEPNTALVFESHGFNDFEPLVAVEIYLRSAGLKNPFYLDIVGYSETTAKSHFERYLLLLTKGSVGPGRRFLAYSCLPPAAPRRIITFSKPELAPGTLANFWPVP